MNDSQFQMKQLKEVHVFLLDIRKAVRNSEQLNARFLRIAVKFRKGLKMHHFNLFIFKAFLKY